jgi:hypothetical protein
MSLAEYAPMEGSMQETGASIPEQARREYVELHQKIEMAGSFAQYLEARNIDLAICSLPEVGTEDSVANAAITSSEVMHKLSCTDEGCSGQFQGVAAGLMLSPQEWISAMRDAGITKVEAHAHCGGAKLYAAHALEQPDMSQMDADRVAAEELQRRCSMAQAQGHAIDCLPMRTDQELMRPVEVHPAGMLNIDVSERFIPQRHPDLPKSFRLTAERGLAVLLDDVRTVLAIAGGAHGLGAHTLTPDTPFRIYITTSENPTDEEAQLLDEIMHQLQALASQGVDAPPLPVAVLIESPIEV